MRIMQQLMSWVREILFLAVDSRNLGLSGQTPGWLLIVLDRLKEFLNSIGVQEIERERERIGTLKSMLISQNLKANKHHHHHQSVFSSVPWFLQLPAFFFLKPFILFCRHLLRALTLALCLLASCFRCVIRPHVTGLAKTDTPKMLETLWVFGKT